MRLESSISEKDNNSKKKKNRQPLFHRKKISIMKFWFSVITNYGDCGDSSGGGGSSNRICVGLH